MTTKKEYSLRRAIQIALDPVRDKLTDYEQSMIVERVLGRAPYPQDLAARLGIAERLLRDIMGMCSDGFVGCSGPGGEHYTVTSCPLCGCLHGEHNEECPVPRAEIVALATPHPAVDAVLEVLRIVAHPFFRDLVEQARTRQTWDDQEQDMWTRFVHAADAADDYFRGLAPELEESR